MKTTYLYEKEIYKTRGHVLGCQNTCSMDPSQAATARATVGDHTRRVSGSGLNRMAEINELFTQHKIDWNGYQRLIREL